MEKFKFYTLWLFGACVIVFILQQIIPGFTELFVLNNKAIYEFQIWRLISAIFLHAGIVHLLYNMFALVFFGLALEKLIGQKRFLLVFFISGIIANIISVFFYPSSLGASGAIYGIIGCLAIIRPMMMVISFGLILPMFLAAIVWIIGDLLGAYGLIQSNTGYIAHLSGVFIGILFGLVFRILYKNKNSLKKEKLNIPDDYIRKWEDSYIK